MNKVTKVLYNFSPALEPIDEPEIRDLSYKHTDAELIIPTGRWKFVNRDGMVNKHNMYIEVEYTKIITGERRIEGYWNFLRYVKEKKEEITYRMKNQTMWINEYTVGFYTTTIYNCGED